MATFNDMINEVRSNLQGYTLRQDRLTYLANTGGITASGTEIQVGSSSNLAKGIIEIDDELIWVDSFDKATSTMNVIPAGFGRGYQGTDAASHAEYAQVILSPTFPRQNIKRAINDTINSFFPKLWGVGSTTFTFNASQTAYTLPAEAESVIYASWQTTGSSLEWLPINRWRMDPMANVTTFGTNNTINIYENIQPGRTVQVFYTKEPTVLANNGDDFASVTGLPSSAYDVVILGASYKLLSFLDPGRINLTSAESDLNDSKIPSNAGVGASRYIYALYQQRLNEEALKLQDKFPIRIHYTK
jgi:hypothetical protein